MRCAYVSVLLCCSLSACAYEEVDTSNTDQAIGGLNGTHLNGRGLNGSNLGNTVKWASFDEVKLNGHELHEVWLEGSELVGEGRHEHIYRGTAFAGAKFEARSDTNKEVKLRIATVQPPPVGSDVWRYFLEFKHAGQWYPLCLADATTGEGLNGPLMNGDTLNQAVANGDVVVLGAVPVDGYWSYATGTPSGGSKVESNTRFTFACPRIGAIGKCIDAGYRPWANAANGTGLDGQHAACVRMMRADYCGDGTPHTIAGTLINVYDDVGVQADTESWGLEAEWDEHGARCITSHNRHANPIACTDRLLDDQCGNPPDWSDGTLLVSETP